MHKRGQNHLIFNSPSHPNNGFARALKYLAAAVCVCIYLHVFIILVWKKKNNRETINEKIKKQKLRDNYFRDFIYSKL